VNAFVAVHNAGTAADQCAPFQLLALFLYFPIANKLDTLRDPVVLWHHTPKSCTAERIIQKLWREAIFREQIVQQ